MGEEIIKMSFPSQKMLLVIQNGPQIGQSFLLTDSVLTLGRNVEADILLDDCAIADLHAEIRFQEGKHIIKCLGKNANIFINGVEVDLDLEGVISPEDTLLIGKVRIKVKLVIDNDFPSLEKLDDRITGEFEQATYQEKRKVKLKDIFVPLFLIYSGNMSDVILVEDTKLKRKVVLKMPSPQVKQQEKEVARFISEVLITAQLCHPNIIPIYQLGFLSNGDAYYTMPYVDGEPFDKIMYKLTFEERLGILRYAAGAVSYAHSKGIWHGDIKTSNILIAKDLKAFVIDWGLASIRRDIKNPNYRLFNTPFREKDIISLKELDNQNSVSGTIAYLSPEQVNGQYEYMGAVSDIWAFGIILFEIITGHHPLDITAPSGAVLSEIGNKDFPTAGDFLPETPSWVKELCRHMLMKDPSKRMQTLDDFIDRLDNHLLKTSSGNAIPSVLGSVEDNSTNPTLNENLILEVERLRVENKNLQQQIVRYQQKTDLLAELSELNPLYLNRKKEIRKKLYKA